MAWLLLPHIFFNATYIQPFFSFSRDFMREDFDESAAALESKSKMVDLD